MDSTCNSLIRSISALAEYLDVSTVRIVLDPIWLQYQYGDQTGNFVY